MITDKEIKAAKPSSDKAYKLTDSKGLYLLIHPNGSKYWRYDYKFDNKRKTLSLGIYPKISLKKARELHTEAVKLILSGADPMIEKKHQLQIIDRDKANTFEVIARKWHDQWKHGKATHYATSTLNGLEIQVFPHIGKIPIKELTYSDIRKIIERQVKQGIFDIAKRTLQKIQQINRYAFVHEYLADPLPDIKPADLIPTRRKKNYARIKTNEIPKLLEDIHAYNGSIITMIAIKLMLLTFVRTSELIKAKWVEIDFKNKRWTIPAERMKMKKEHIVPLSKQAIELLTELQNYSSGTPWLFPSSHGRKGEKSISNNTILFSLYRMGYKDKMTGHGFRGLASTALHELDYNHQVIEIQLAHTENNRVSAAYNHALYLPQREKMMQDWSDYIYHLAPSGF